MALHVHVADRNRLDQSLVPLHHADRESHYQYARTRVHGQRVYLDMIDRELANS